MATNSNANFIKALQRFATEVTSKFSLSSISFNPEDQLKAPIDNLLKEVGNLLQLEINSVTEIQEKELSGRPDFGVTVRSLLAGHIELKAPNKSIEPKDKISLSLSEALQEIVKLTRSYRHYKDHRVKLQLSIVPQTY